MHTFQAIEGARSPATPGYATAAYNFAHANSVPTTISKIYFQPIKTKPSNTFSVTKTKVALFWFDLLLHIYPPVAGSDASTYRTIRTLFIAMTTLCLKEFAPA